MHQKVYAPPLLQLGFEVDGSESNDVSFTFASRLTLLDLAGHRSEWRTDFIFGSTYGIESELYRPFSAASKWFFAPHASARNSNFMIYRKSDPLAEYRFSTASIGGDLGYGFSRFSEIRLGYEVGTLDARLRLGTAEFASISGRTGNTRLRYRMDRTDDLVIARSGLDVVSNFRWFDSSPGETTGFPVMEAQVGYFHSITNPPRYLRLARAGLHSVRPRTVIRSFSLAGLPGSARMAPMNSLAISITCSVRVICTTCCPCLLWREEKSTLSVPLNSRRCMVSPLPAGFPAISPPGFWPRRPSDLCFWEQASGTAHTANGSFSLAGCSNWRHDLPAEMGNGSGSERVWSVFLFDCMLGVGFDRNFDLSARL
jgi:hypothetical protein